MIGISQSSRGEEPLNLGLYEPKMVCSYVVRVNDQLLPGMGNLSCYSKHKKSVSVRIEFISELVGKRSLVLSGVLKFS